MSGIRSSEILDCGLLDYSFMIPYGDTTNGNNIFNFIRLYSIRPMRYTRSKPKTWDKEITILISTREVTGSVHGQATIYDTDFLSSTYVIIFQLILR
jgi:hypothetical protein